MERKGKEKCCACARNTYRAHFTNFGSLVCCGRCWLSLYNAHRLRLDLDAPYGHLLLVVVVVALLAANEQLIADAGVCRTLGHLRMQGGLLGGGRFRRCLRLRIGPLLQLGRLGGSCLLRFLQRSSGCINNRYTWTEYWSLASKAEVYRVHGKRDRDGASERAQVLWKALIDNILLML